MTRLKSRYFEQELGSSLSEWQIDEWIMESVDLKLAAESINGPAKYCSAIRFFFLEESIGPDPTLPLTPGIELP